MTQLNIHDLDQYMLTHTVMDKIARSGYIDTTFLKKQKVLVTQEKVPTIPISETSNKEQDNTKQEINKNNSSSEIFVPEEKDTLFWCFYILAYGIDKYNGLHSRNIVVEKKIKIDFIEIFRQNNIKSIIKERKLGPISHIENSLLNEKTIDLKTFEAMCIIKDLSCVYLFNRCYHPINIEDDENNYESIPTPLIVKKSYPEKYGYVENCSLIEIRNTKHEVTNISKPLKAMTSYKLEELVVLCNKLNIDVEGNKRKKNLYEELVKTICV